MTAHLLDHHRGLLEARAIAPAVIKARGYSTTVLPSWLREQRFSRRVSELVPGLVIPVYDVLGDLRFRQYRPDKPRLRDGKPVKYETPPHTRTVLDVPPQALGKLGDPGPPLLVTEGPLKADAAVSAGWVCIATFGVWGFRGTNHRGGKTALPDWEHIALIGRDVYLVPDSDVATNPKVAAAVARLGALLDFRGADVHYVTLPCAEDGAKLGLDDWLARYGPDLGGLLTLADDDPPRLAARGGTHKAGTPPAAAPKPTVPPPDDPARLLHDLHDWLTGYVAFPSGHAAVAVTLWIAHTHLAACFDSTGRLVLLSPEPECGKTRVLELAELTCAEAEFLNDASAAYLFRRIDDRPVTLLLDEADAIWKRKGDETAEAVRSILNAGHRKGASVGRAENHGATLTRFKVYAPAALAAKGDPLPDTIMSRAIVIHLRRRTSRQRVKRYRARITRPQGETLRDQLAAWAADAEKQVGDPWPSLPKGVDDRPADVWEPLLTVADLAGSDWPDLARKACLALVKSARDDSQAASARLLADIRDTWCKRPREVTGTSGTSDTCLIRHVPVVPHVPLRGTGALLRDLCALEESPWGDYAHGRPLSAHGLANLLRPYGIAPVRVHIGERFVRGYTCASFHDAWSRYLPAIKRPRRKGGAAPKEKTP